MSIIKKYKKGSKGLKKDFSNDIPIQIVEIVDTECVVVIFKWWNKYKRIWIYEGKPFVDILYWNSLLNGLDKSERVKLFELNGFDYYKCLGLNKT